MASKESYLEIKNSTKQNFSISVSEVDNYDWDGNSRPDHNFQGVTIQPETSNKQREELNKYAKSAWFRMTLNFAGGQTATFRNDQYDAINGISPNPRSYTLEGKDKSLFSMQQQVSSSGPTSTFTLSYASSSVSQKNWMKGITGSRSITSFTLPGTYQSAASVPAAGPQKTQTLTITEQLNLGIRYFDLNVVNHYGKIVFVYGNVIEKGDRIKDIFTEFSTFLSENPTEAILVSINDVANDPKDFASIAINFLKDFSSQVYSGNVIPTLDQARGKMVIVRRFVSDGVYGLDMENGWPADGTAILKYTASDGVRQTIQVQNHNTAASLEHKFEDVRYLLDLAADYSGPLYVNRTNVQLGFTPSGLQAYAEQMNALLLDYVTKRQANTNCGAVLLSFPTADLVNAMLKGVLTA